MVVKNTQHYIHNSQAFLENNAIKAANNQMWAQFIESGVSNLTSIFMCNAANGVNGGGSTTTTTTKTEKTINEAVVPSEEPKETDASQVVKDMIDDFDQLPKTTQNALIERYNKLIDKNGKDFDKALIKLNLNNYLKGMSARGIEQKFGLSEELCSEEIVIDGVDEAVQKGDTVAYIEAYRTAAKEFIAQYDIDGDGKINLSELEGNLPSLTDEADKKELAAAFLATINRDADAENLDMNEVAAYLLSMARINDYDNGTEIAKTGSSINQSEYASTLGVIMSNTKSVRDYEAAIKDRIAPILLKAGISTAEYLQLDDFSTLTGIDEDERFILQEFKDNNLHNHALREILEEKLTTNYNVFAANLST
ncbi:MAG: hypothetical protein NC408_08555 [Candidatus Gastranaerophilales bacterium]|nr:hypothetical protein [Candidatus Gastranaerophilales bacterium]MCM1073491.1 hypothetical protein [Bacteroides sp.]